MPMYLSICLHIIVGDILQLHKKQQNKTVVRQLSFNRHRVRERKRYAKKNFFGDYLCVIDNNKIFETNYVKSE